MIHAFLRTLKRTTQIVLSPDVDAKFRGDFTRLPNVPGDTPLSKLWWAEGKNYNSSCWSVQALDQYYTDRINTAFGIYNLTTLVHTWESVKNRTDDYDRGFMCSQLIGIFDSVARGAGHLLDSDATLPLPVMLHLQVAPALYHTLRKLPLFNADKPVSVAWDNAWVAELLGVKMEAVNADLQKKREKVAAAHARKLAELEEDYRVRRDTLNEALKLTQTFGDK